MPRGAKPKDYPSGMVASVATIYRAGSTIAETAWYLGVSKKVIWNLMRRHGVERRVAAKRSQCGAANSSWKGAEAGYQAKHVRVATLRGKPLLCSRCGTDDPAKDYDWANLTGDYDDASDYERMCRSCHRRYDNGRRHEEVV